MTSKAYKDLTKTEANRPGAYESKWQNTLDNLLDQIVNRKAFSYDYNQDPLYQNFKDTYSAAGRNAMQDTAAQAAALTGGYGSSAATTAANGVYQQYMQDLAGKIPELYQLAMDKYQLDSNELQQKYSVVGNEENRNYSRHRDTVGDWQADRSYGLNKYSTFLGGDQFRMNYNQAESQFNQQMEEQKRQFNADMAYKYSKLV
jgi:hypothetical protein